MKLGTITRAFRALWIAGFVLLLACIVLSFLEDGDVIGYDGNWLYWIAGILLVCTILSITTFLMAIVAIPQTCVRSSLQIQETRRGTGSI